MDSGGAVFINTEPTDGQSADGVQGQSFNLLISLIGPQTLRFTLTESEVSHCKDGCLLCSNIS